MISLISWVWFEGGSSFLFSLFFFWCFLVTVIYIVCTLVPPFLALFNIIFIYLSKKEKGKKKLSFHSTYTISLVILCKNHKKSWGRENHWISILHNMDSTTSPKPCFYSSSATAWEPLQQPPLLSLSLSLSLSCACTCAQPWPRPQTRTQYVDIQIIFWLWSCQDDHGYLNIIKWPFYLFMS